MATETQETIVDIIAKMRQGMNPNGTAECQYLESDICILADRLDRARMKMEIEMANLRKENAKLRDALAKIRSEAYECDQGGEYLGEGSDPGFDRIVKMCDAALTTTSNQNTQDAKKI